MQESVDAAGLPALRPDMRDELACHRFRPFRLHGRQRGFAEQRPHRVGLVAVAGGA